jgi:hypothetical protein
MLEKCNESEQEIREQLKKVEVRFCNVLILKSEEQVSSTTERGKVSAFRTVA